MGLVSLQTAASGMSAQNRAIDVIANNIANVNTTGFKSSRANFQDIFYQTIRRAGAEDSSGLEDPVGYQVGLGTQLLSTQKSFLQGSIVTTEQPLDVAVEGVGFLQIEVPSDVAANSIAYTRAGALTLNSNGEIVTQQGYRLTPAITVPQDARDITIRTDGTVVVTTPGDPAGTQVGQIELARFVNPTGLSGIGETLFEETQASGTPQTGFPATGEFGLLRQGALENSNVNVVREIVSLIESQRAFEFNAQTIRAADEMLQLISNLRRL